MKDNNALKACPIRIKGKKELGPSPTGIFIRALNEEGKWDTIDLYYLNAHSLHCWLRSRGGENEWAENTVALLLNHDMNEFEQSNKKYK